MGAFCNVMNGNGKEIKIYNPGEAGTQILE